MMIFLLEYLGPDHLQRHLNQAFSTNEPVFLVSEFSLRYLLIFKDQNLVLDFIS